VEALAAIERRVLSMLVGRSVAVVALDGFSAAGKSTLAAALSDRLDSAVIHGDDFYRDMPEQERLGLSPAGGIENYFDWRRMRSEVLEPLRQGRSATYRPFDWATGGGFGDPVTVDSRPVVVVEGVYSARPELASVVDVAVFVDTPEHERTQRRALRHDPTEWEVRWDAAEELYFRTVRPVESFDLVVPGIGWSAVQHRADRAPRP
jgi:uridine kinase